MKKKRGILYWLRVVVAVLLIFILMYRCSHNYGITAYAIEGVHYLPLTPQQTVALYGTQITALLGDAYSDDTQSIVFDYAFPLSSVGYMDEGTGFSASRFYDSTYYIENQPSLTSAQVRDLWCDRSGLVYVADASQWGDTPISGFGYNSGSPFQLHIPFSVTFHNITRFRTNLFYSCQPLRVTGPFNPNTRNIFKALTDIANVDFYSVRGDTYAGINSAASMPLPTYPYYSNNPLDESQLGYFSGFIVDLYEDNNYTTEFDLTGATVDAFLIKSVCPSSNDIWLIVGCPTIYGYDPPEITTTRPPETVPIATYAPATMPTDVTDRPLIVINDNSVTQVNQLNLIIGQLNLIYAKLCAEGELGLDVDLGWNPDIQDGENLPYYDTQIQSQMHDIINGHTTATVPHYDTSFVKDGYSFLTDTPWVAALGALSLALSVAGWIIFKGRG